jgi:hypothetical protein
MPRFFEHHRLTPDMVAAAINAANPQASDGRESVLKAVVAFHEVLKPWYDAAPLESKK